MAGDLVEGSRKQYFLGTAMLVLVVLMWTSVSTKHDGVGAGPACVDVGPHGPCSRG